MKKSKLTGIIAFLLCLVFLLGACAKPTQQTAVTAPSDEAAAQVVESTTVKSVEASEISLYEVKDGDYTIKISPIYQKDGKTVAAAYILSVKDKDNKEVKAADFPALLSVVQATSTKNAITLTKDKNKQYIIIKSYADEKGNLLILQDAADVNKNGKTDEFLQLTKVTNDKGSTHYLLTDTVIKLVTEKNTVYAIIGGKKIKVDVVNSKNTKVKAKIESESKEKKKTASTTKKTSAATTKKTETPAEKTDTYGRIVLLKDGMAKSDLDGVTLAQNEVLIHKGGDYLITSDTSVWHGVIKIQLNNTEEADVRFENVDIAYNKSNIIQILDSSDSSKRDFIETEANEESIDYDDLNDAMDELSDVKSAPNVSLTFPTGTASSFECSSNIKTGVIYNESKLEIKGNGKVSISATANANNV
ncbi:MAG: hypothetical protein E7520_00210, partial [Ruminococcaceae bacterium]|nr:hypothetical protein [Oscillospiraceae bacterium]